MIKKPCLFALVLLLISIQAISQTYVFQMRNADSKLWGYANVNGEIIIEPQYKMCYSFSEEGIAPVYYSLQNHYDFINLNNEVLEIGPDGLILKDSFGYGAKGFSSGITPIRIRKKWGAMNIKGEIVCPLKYDLISVFVDGYASAHIKKQYYVLDKQGNEHKILTEDIKDIKRFNEGFAPYRNKKGNSGFVNTKGEVAIPAQYNGVGYFNSGFAWARTKKGLIGFINTNGDWVIQPQFSAVKNFDPSTGFAKACVNGLWGFLDKEGNMYYLDVADKFYNFSEGTVKAVRDGLVGFLDTKFNWTIEPRYENARDFRNGFAAAKFDGGWGIIDKAGNWVIEPIYGAIKDVIQVSK